jgi:acyl dehydratase
MRGSKDKVYSMSNYDFPIEAGHVMMFARSIGDANPIYYDKRYARDSVVGKLITPPTFVQAGAQFDPNNRLRPKLKPHHSQSTNNSSPDIPKKNNDKPRTSSEKLHAEQHYKYHQPIAVGETLKVSSTLGKTWEKKGRRSGKLVFKEYVTEYRSESGELKVTARAVVVSTEKFVPS